MRTPLGRRFRRALPFAVAGACFFVSLHAQQPSPAQAPTSNQPPQPPPQFRTEANFVRVDVYATKDGAPVRDLTAADFQVIEDGVPQRVETFEHVLIRPSGSQAARIEPDNQEAGNQMAGNPRNRMFVLFLDTYHVSVNGSHDIRGPIINLLDRALGPDDLIAVMTPEMSASDIVFARKTEVLQRGLTDNWIWGRRFREHYDDRELQYLQCYPPTKGEQTATPGVSNLAAKMIDRRREQMVMDSLRDLIVQLRDIRDERKAVLAVTEGWALYQPDETVTRLRAGEAKREGVPGVDTIFVGEGGKLTTSDDRDPYGATKYSCDADRMRLAMMDDERYFRDIMGDANRTNVSFYPIDPRGLPVFDTPIGPAQPLPPNADLKSLHGRLETLRTLAVNTDGVAILDSNDLEKGLRRLADDLTSYYLLGYYSTNAKADGRYHTIDVKVTRPGISVRARHGYRSATAEEVAAARAAAGAPVPDAKAAVQAAVGVLSRLDTRGRIGLQAAAIRHGAGAVVWIAGEVPRPAGGEPDPLAEGGDVAIEVSTNGAGSRTAQATLTAAERSFLSPVSLDGAPNGEISIRARLRGAAGSGMMDAIAIDAPADGATGPVLFRRGPSTGNRVQPAGRPEFSRTERLHAELPVDTGVQIASAVLLDREGTTLQIPATTSERTDVSGQRWLTADVVLAPLGAGDYLLQLTTKRGTEEQRTLTAFRVTR